MGIATVIPQNTFESLQLDAGVIVKTFDPSSPSIQDRDIICATTGGITASCVPTYSDLGADVDNCPANMMELKHLDSWETKLAFTSLGTSKESIRMSLGAADINAETGAVTPRRDLAQTDFSDVWWVGDRADGGLVAVQLKNALSTSGFSLKTTKSGKGQVSVELTGHVSIMEQNVMPMVIYSIDPATYLITASDSIEHGSVSFTVGGNAAVSAKPGDTVTITAAPDEGYELDTLSATKSGGAVTVTNGSFVMPNGDVTVSATFKSTGN